MGTLVCSICTVVAALIDVYGERKRCGIVNTVLLVGFNVLLEEGVWHSVLHGNDFADKVAVFLEMVF